MTALPCALATLSLLACAGAAAASEGGATVWRCGSVYSDVPCGEGVTVAVADVRTASQLAQARQVAARDAAHARSHPPQRPARPYVAVISLAAPAPRPARDPKPARPEIYRAIAPASR